MGSVKERTQKEIEEYIRQHSQDGKLTESLLHIAEQIGYSNATVHRALQALERKGLIQIEKSDKPTEPNTIIFKGDKNEIDNLLSRGVQLSNQMKNNAAEFDEYLQKTNWVIRQLREENERLKAAKERNKGEIVNITQLPDTNFELVTIKREADREEVHTGA